MALLAGIDEAGFGPLLGPLVVSASAFRVPDARVEHCLWDTLQSACASGTARGERRLVVADSKLLHRPAHEPVLLERAALVMLAAAGSQPGTLRQMLRVVGPRIEADLDAYPWYAMDLPLPVCPEIGDVSTRANAVRRAAAEHQVELLGACCELLPEGEYNRLVRGTRNKSTVLIGLVMRLVDRLLRLGTDELIHIQVDRLGGRAHYREPLSTALPQFELRILHERPEHSAYELTAGTRRCRIEFVTGAEQRYFAVALASIYSKYLREMFMKLFNGYWCGHQPDLRPTAGYYTDARRWLADAGDVLRARGVDRGLLVRER